MSATPETGVTRATNSFRRVGSRTTRKATIIAFFTWLFAVFGDRILTKLSPTDQDALSSYGRRHARSVTVAEQKPKLAVETGQSGAKPTY
jgi:hypothetical protein